MGQGMGQGVELPIAGRATATVTVNLRQGAASVQAPVLRKLSAGVTIAIEAVVVGDNVQGNAHWYRTSDPAYAWAGAFSPFQAVNEFSGSAAEPINVQGTGLNTIPLVVDIFHGDGVASFNQAYAAGLRGVIHKATTGATGRDDEYRTRRDVAKTAGLWGATHWGTAAPVENQVHNFLEWAEPDAQTLVALDFERDDGNQMTLSGAREFLTLINTKLSRKAVLYSGDTIKTALGKTVDAFFGSHRLWLAQYGNSPIVQNSWQNYWLWQYTDGESGPGCKAVPGLIGDAKHRLDCNHFAGTANDLAEQWAS
jgi:GH25 family lysozyme M1 (1,4-beta-N-acetylmuramidase)